MCDFDFPVWSNADIGSTFSNPLFIIDLRHTNTQSDLYISGLVND